MELKTAIDFIVCVNHSNYEKCCELLWNTNSDVCMKCIMFVLDQKKDEELFITLMKWVYEHHPESFDKNISLIVGIHNTHTLTDDELIHIAS